MNEKLNDKNTKEIITEIENMANNGSNNIKVLTYSIMYFGAPIFLCIFLELCNRKSFVSTFNFIMDKPYLFVFNTLIISAMLLISLFFRRRIFVYTMGFSVCFAFGIIDFVLLKFRVTPFSSVDFSLIISAIDVANHYFSIFQLILIIVAILAFIALMVFLFLKTPLVQIESNKWYLIPLAIFLANLAAIFTLYHTNSYINSYKENYTNITEMYDNYGFVYCFVNGIVDKGIKEPETYSNEEIDQILDNLKDEENDTEKPNIIFVQLESFFDVNTVDYLSFSKDPLPNFHKLQSKYSSGYITVPTVGAGTVNTEFEILTGMNQHDFGASEYPYKTKLKEQTCESICYDLKNLGYTSHCVHNNTAKFYGRNTVFSNLGFDTFTTLEYMRNIALNPVGWATDKCMAEEIIKTLDSTEGTDFTFGITVQSHGKYDVEGYTNKHVDTYGAPEEMAGQFNYFVDQCYEVDAMIGNLVKKLKHRDEKTILVLYGDHLPTLGLTKDDLVNGSIYQTEYVIWDNMGLKKRNININSYQLYSYALDLVGIHEGTITKFHQQTDWNIPDYVEQLKELEYDFLYGENYVYGETNPFVPTDLKMGTYPITMDDVVYNNGIYYVHGSNFSDNCTVYFNDEKVNSTVVSSGIIQINDEIIFDEELIEKYNDKSEEEKMDLEYPNSFKVVVEDKNEEILSESNLVKWDETSIGKD